MRRDSPLQLPLRVFLVEFQKIEGVLVPDGQFGLRPQFRRQRFVESGLPQEGFLIGLVFNLVNQDIFRSAELTGHTDIKLALQRILASL